MPLLLLVDHTHDVYNDIYYTKFYSNENNDVIYKILNPLILLLTVIAILHYMLKMEPDKTGMV